MMRTFHVLLILLCLIVVAAIVDRAMESPEDRQIRQARAEQQHRQKMNSQYAKLRAAMAYLGQVPEVAWYEVNKNNVYIGFDPLPADWQLILKGAALRGNEAIGFGFHAWACDAAVQPWRPGDRGFYGEQSARYGRLE